MKVLIIEDENIAAQRLRKSLLNIDPSMQVLAMLQSIEESVEWLREQGMPDLIFMDIHLADGTAFSIFDQVKVSAPVVFTTAYDQYALQAFKVNSIDYLLKPVEEKDLRNALDKYQSVAGRKTLAEADLQRLTEMLGAKGRTYKSYFLVPRGTRLLPLSVSEIACLYLEEKISHIVTFDGATIAMDKPLDTIFEQLDPAKFFRVNRQYIVAHKAIADIMLGMFGKLRLNLSVKTPGEIVVPRAKVPEFKEWYSR